VFRVASRLFPDFGYIGTQLEVSPDRIDEMADKIREVAAQFKAVESNGLWMSVLSQAQTDPEVIARFRTRDEAYQNMTVEDLIPLATEVFEASDSLEIQILPNGQ